MNDERRAEYRQRVDRIINHRYSGSEDKAWETLLNAAPRHPLLVLAAAGLLVEGKRSSCFTAKKLLLRMHEAGLACAIVWRPAPDGEGYVTDLHEAAALLRKYFRG